VGALSAAELVGREREFEVGRRFLVDLVEGARGLVFCGEAGIGKTVVWRQVADEARGAGYRLLVARCVQAEMQLGFATLADVLEDVVDEVSADLLPVQRAALDFALRRSDPGSAAPDALTVSRAVLGVLRLLAAVTPVVLAIDDVQWVDAASARVLAFSLRRLEGARVGALLTQRDSGADEDPLLLAALTEGCLERVELEPLSMGALRYLIRGRAATSLSRPLLVRLHEASGGNPMYALEFVTALGESPNVEALPMPASLRELVRDRLGMLPASLRPFLELVATLGHPRLELLERVSSEPVAEPLQLAAAAGALVIEDEQWVRFSHPLLASAVYADAGSARRRELHRTAAQAVTDVEERARHLALAAAEPDEETAILLDVAAERAHGRGAPDAAAELAEWAQRLTPAGRESDRQRRLIHAAGYLVEAGDEQDARRLLDLLLETQIPDAIRAEALLVRASAEWNNRPALLESLRGALECARDEPRVHCEALLRYAWQGGHVAGDEVAAAEWVREALVLAEQVGDPGLREQASVLAMEIATFRGQPFPELPPEPNQSVLREVRQPQWGMVSRRGVIGRQLMFRGQLQEARAKLTEELERVSRQGSELTLAVLHQVLTELELHAGNWELARRYAEDGFGIMREAGGNGEMIVRIGRGRLAAHQGRVDDAFDDLNSVVSRAEDQHDVLQGMRARRSLGFLHLSLGDHNSAWDSLADLPERVERAGMNEPGAVGALLPDAVETLVALGRLDEAEALTARLEGRALALAHAWATPASQRCRGLVLLARSELEQAVDAFESSQTGFKQIDFPFDRARSLLALGDVFRRAGQRRRAAEKLEEARSIFTRLGAPLWLERAETELRRASPRPRSDRELTAAETRVARLVASGTTNKEVASRLFTTVATVEAHLTRIYRKLGVRSRIELARKVAEGTIELPDP
jgi:DNA-binding NarL/FixJ family response regulator